MKLQDVLNEIKSIRASVHESDADEIDSKLGDLETRITESLQSGGGDDAADATAGDTAAKG